MIQVRLITKMFNESEFIKTFLTYYIEEGIDEIVIFDDESTDQSVELANQFKPFVSVFKYSQKYISYDLRSDEERCQELFSTALQLTEKPTWWLFPDIDELIQSYNNTKLTLADQLREINGIDGIPCIGLHCLPRIPEDSRFMLPPEKLIPMLDIVAPPRSFEPSHQANQAWKTPIWFFGNDARQHYEGLRYSSGCHLLFGDTSHLRYLRPAWKIYHYKVRTIHNCIEHTKQILNHVSLNSHYREKFIEIISRIEKWSESNYRILRLCQVLKQDAIEQACRVVEPPGIYYETPFKPGIWGR